MKIPKLKTQVNTKTLYVNDKPFLVLGGELHNSSSSNLEYMDKKVWGNLKSLNMNTVLAAVSWEQIEPQKGIFNFTLVDGLIEQARRESFKLILLWFGLWKNAQSTYIPQWMKNDPQKYFRSKIIYRADCMRSQIAISPCCDDAIYEDINAFRHLMAHLKEFDGNENTVIMIQVENESGLLGCERDFSAQAEEIFQAEIPQELKDIYGQTGNWQTAFGDEAASLFMSYHFAKAIGKISEAGKEIYPLPMYVNAWTVQYPNERPGSYPSGGPIAEHMPLWRKFAPCIDIYSPDIYLPDFAAECSLYAQNGNPLFVPEARNSNSAASYLLYAVGKHHAIGFSPFAIEDVEAPDKGGFISGIFQAVLAEGSNEDNINAGSFISKANSVIDSMKDIIFSHRGKDTMTGFLNHNHIKDVITLGGYEFLISYFPKRDSEPTPAGIIISQGNDEFIVVGMGFRLEFFPSRGEKVDVEILCAEDGEFINSNWNCTRVRNGDEYFLAFDSTINTMKIKLRKNRI